MTIKKGLKIGAVLLLYAVTGIQGSRVLQREMESRAEGQYAQALVEEARTGEMYTEQGIEVPESYLNPEGPRAGVNWAVPVLPLVLVADTYEILGPRWGRGGIEIVIYLGFGTVSIPTPFGWIS